MQLETKVGLTDLSSGAKSQLRSDTGGGLLAQVYGGKYAEAARAGRLFCVANTAPVTTTKDNAAIWTGLGVANPTGSDKNIIIHEFSWALQIAGSDDGLVGLATTTDFGFATTLTARSCYFGTGTSIAECVAGTTIAVPILERVCGTHGMGAVTVQIAIGPNNVDLAGSMILPPGRAVVTWTSEATTSGLMFSFLWEEVDA
jgi:hypothetical protein